MFKMGFVFKDKNLSDENELSTRIDRLSTDETPTVSSANKYDFEDAGFTTRFNDPNNNLFKQSCMHSESKDYVSSVIYLHLNDLFILNS